MKRFRPWIHLALGIAYAALLGILQNTELVTIFGVKPNLVLAFLIALAFSLRDFWRYLAVLLTAVLFLQYQHSFDLGVVLLAAIALAIFLFTERFPARTFVNVAIAVSGGTLAFYALVQFPFLLREPLTVFLELVYNVVGGIFFYGIIHFLFSYEKAFRASS